jgi:hypothetical protein
MHAGALPDELVLAHRLVGYLTAFFVAPMTLTAFAEAPRHRLWARTYLGLMIPLYLTGLYFTFQRHELRSFVWRAILPSIFSDSFPVSGWRAIWRFRLQALQPTRLDHAMRAALLAVSAGLVALGVLHHFPSFVLGSLGLWLGLVVFREAAEARALYVTHQRCMLACSVRAHRVVAGACARADGSEMALAHIAGRAAGGLRVAPMRGGRFGSPCA